jgi:hypothetical protein
MWLLACGIVAAGSYGYPPQSFPRPYRLPSGSAAAMLSPAPLETLYDCHSLDKSFQVSQAMQLRTA